MEKDKCCCKDNRIRSEEKYKKLQNRLSRIEGQMSRTPNNKTSFLLT